MVRPLSFLCLCLVLASCSMRARRDQADVRDLYRQGLYKEALARLESSEIREREENRLLYLLQKGKLLRADGKNLLAARVFVEASELMDKLYTKSVSEALLTSISNNNNETYFGSPYERSFLFYYQALSFLDIYQSGKVLNEVKETVKDKEGNETVKTSWVEKELDQQERRRYLFRARASVVAWDVFYKELQRSSRESTKFDRDLFAKILGAQVHELVGGREDERIALQLYRDAYEILNKLGPAFKSFNLSFELYSKAIHEEGSRSAKDLGQKKESTGHYKELADYLKKKILALAKKRQKWKYKALLKELEPSPSVLKDSQEPSNVTLLLETGAVAPLQGEDFSYNLRAAIEKVEDPAARAFIEGIGLPVLTYFAMGPLGLASVSQSGNAKLYVRHGVGEAMTAEAGIEFEMPVIKEPALAPERAVHIYRQNGKQEELVATKNAVLAGPVSDLAYQTNLERISNAFADRGTRIAVKHVLAIIAAYKTYEMVKKSSGEMFAKPAAFAQYLVSAKAIKESERADTRQWSVLPSEIFLAELALPPGEYIVKADNGEGTQLTEIGAFSVNNRQREIFSLILP